MRVVVFQHRRSALILGVKPKMDFSVRSSGSRLMRFLAGVWFRRWGYMLHTEYIFLILCRSEHVSEHARIMEIGMIEVLSCTLSYL